MMEWRNEILNNVYLFRKYSYVIFEYLKVIYVSIYLRIICYNTSLNRTSLYVDLSRDN